MTGKLTRRRFLSTSAAAGVSLGLGGGVLGGLLTPGAAMAGDAPDLVAMTGDDPFRNATTAVNGLGGMARFVKRGSRVVINANTAFKHPGSIVHPAVSLAVLDMCLKAGATEVMLLKGVPDGYWKRGELMERHADTISAARVSEQENEVVEIAGAKALKKAHVDKRLLGADVYINVAVVKDHKGCGFTGALKNAMGASPHDPTCLYCHRGDNQEGGWYDDVDHLSQCIADLNLIRRPDLCVLDATEHLMTNGPFGPGELRRSRAVVAGTDPVAIDAYGARFLDLAPEKISMIARAHKLGVGNPDLSALSIREAEPA